MVRFKNRWLLVEFIFPFSQPVPAALAMPSPPGGSSTGAHADAMHSAKGKGKRKAPAGGSSKRKRRDPSSRTPAGDIGSSSSEEDDSELEDDTKALDDPPAFLHPRHPLLLPPPPNGSTGQARTLGEKAIHAALKASVLQAFGDDGWAKVASNTNVKYYSSQTQTAILRTSRDHYRLVQAALAFLGPVNNERVIANVLHVSGTIKKIQLRQIAHNRLLVATILASLAFPPAADDKPLVLPSPSIRPPTATGSDTPASSSVEGDEERERRWKAWEEKEKGVISGLVD